MTPHASLPVHKPTPQQQELIERIAGFLQGEPCVQSAYLSGSLGKGRGDAFSDVDVLVVTADGAAVSASASIATRIGRIAEPVLVNALFGGRVLNVVTEDWRRFDLSFAEERELSFHDGGALVELFHRGGARPGFRPPRPYRTDAVTVRRLVDEFLRVCGLSVVAIGRGEHLLMLTGIHLLRQMTMDLMLEENGVGPAERGGALHRNPFLTADQRAALEAVPPLVATAESALAAQVYLTGVFLPRARRLAAEVGMDWPVAFEEATKRHLEKAIGLRWPQAE